MCARVCTCVHVCTCMYMCVCAYECVCVCARVCVHVYMHVRVCVCVCVNRSVTHACFVRSNPMRVIIIHPDVVWCLKMAKGGSITQRIVQDTSNMCVS